MASECIENSLDWFNLAPAITSAIAAIFAANAAWKLYLISKDNFNFQKILIKNKSDLSYIDIILKNLIKLKLFAEINPLDQTDNYEEDYDFLVSNIREFVNLLSNSKKDIPQLSEFNDIASFYEIVNNNPSYLTDKINELKKIRDSLFFE